MKDEQKRNGEKREREQEGARETDKRDGEREGDRQSERHNHLRRRRPTPSITRAASSVHRSSAIFVALYNE